ncbi:MAG: hypothetical protein HC811_13765 [Flammeovirgaceae bacterium]|nr:hypothetical protein [Flammeovirgaceae bacterium]
MGYDKENVIVIERAGVLAEQQQAFVDELKNIPGVKSTAASGSLPINQYFGIQFQVPGKSEVFTTNGMIIDDEYAEMIGFEIVQGRGFSNEYSDSLSILINEQTVALLGVENPIGMIFKNTNGNPPVTRDLTIIGVVRDFNYMSLRERITPFVYSAQK